MPDLVFEVTKQRDGSYYAACRTEDIFAQAKSREELEAKIREAVKKMFFKAADGYKIHLRTARY